MSELTPEQEELKAIEAAVQWRDTECPKGLLDPLTGALHAITTHKIRAYIDGSGGDGSPAWLSKAVEALWSELIWFGAMPPKPQPKRTPKPPPPEPPGPLGRQSHTELRTFEASEAKRHQKAMRDKLNAIFGDPNTKVNPEDVRPGAVYYSEGHPQSGKINWRATKDRQDVWDKKHSSVKK